MNRLLFFCCFLLTTNAIYGQFKKTAPKSIFQALESPNVVGVILETDLDSLITHRNRDTYQPAQFAYFDKRGRRIDFSIKLRPRGKFRRKICDFPMIKIDFPKKALKKRGYAKFDDYKLVTHCLNEDVNRSYESIAREYLAYKLYNILSPDSYRTQFLYVSYVDTKKVVPTFQHFAFVIEDTAELRERRMAKSRKELAGLRLDSLDIDQYNFVALFQYMIGNTDWVGYPIPRNVKVVKMAGYKKYTLVPFDFDFSGLVAAPYAVPNSALNQRNIRHRIFQGERYDADRLAPTFDHFLSKKKKILKYVKRFHLLSKESRKDIKDFLMPFFEEIENRTISATSGND